MLRLAAVFVLFATPAMSGSLGDFERPRPSVIHEEVLPFLGGVAAGFRKEPVSDFPYTDAERELRDRSWSLLMPPLAHQDMQRWRAEMRRTRISSIERTVPDRKNYVEELLDKDYRSSSARFARLEMDIRNDRTRYPSFVVVANLVTNYDRIRARSLSATPDLTPKEVKNAEGRIGENALLVSAVQTSMHERAATYRYALERLVIQTPDDAAIGAERELLALEAEIGLRVPPPARTIVTGK